MTDSTPQHNANIRVMVGMSGGVDSSVSAYLLIEQGYQVEGLFMKNWDEDDGSEYCSAKQDLADAEQVCEGLGIKLHTANFASEYWDNVFDHFLAEYSAGRTPNPDVLCNREIKFKVFIEYAELLGADYIATGHYVRTRTDGEHTHLLTGLDNNKDQSYFLNAVSEQELAKCLFPIGDMEKPAVRAIAEAQGFGNHQKKDSTGICFIGERRFKDFLEQYLPAQPGDIETPEGQVIGQHSGLMYHTLGQRQGLGLGGIKDFPEAPWYVVDKDLERNVLIAAQGNDHPMLFADQLMAAEVHWINTLPPAKQFSCEAKIRYRQQSQSCHVEISDDPELGQIVTVSFDEPQRSITPGQYVVFYQGELCLGGAVIHSSSRPVTIQSGAI